jgi:hypothetical protein
VLTNQLFQNTQPTQIIIFALKMQKIITRIQHYTKRARKALKIKRHANTLNRDDGHKLGETCRPVMNMLRGQEV